MGTACACAPPIPQASPDSRPSEPRPSPGASSDAPRQRSQRPVHDDVGRQENGQADVCLRLTDHRRTAEYKLKVVTLGLIGDVLRRRGLRFPPDDWDTISVIWRKGTFRAPNAVPDSVRRPLPADESLRVLAVPAGLAWLVVRVEAGVKGPRETRILDQDSPGGTSTTPGDRPAMFRPATPRSSGGIGRGLCVLHEPPHPTEYTHPSSSRSRPSCIAPR